MDLKRLQVDSEDSDLIRIYDWTLHSKVSTWDHYNKMSSNFLGKFWKISLIFILWFSLQRTKYKICQRTTKSTIRRATSKDSDQTAHPRSLIRVFADRTCLLQPPRYPTRNKGEHLTHWVDGQLDLSILAGHPITKTCLYNFDSLKPHFYIVKLGITGVYIIFLISAQKHRLWVLVRTASSRRF